MNFQARVRKWLETCFGLKIANNASERNLRFLEEALELVQANGLTEGQADIVLKYVFSRPSGELKQECGGVVITLAALCAAADIDYEQCALDELCRAWEKIDAIREKHRRKPKEVLSQD